MRHYDFVLVSDFDIRISNLDRQVLSMTAPTPRRDAKNLGWLLSTTQKTNHTQKKPRQLRVVRPNLKKFPGRKQMVELGNSGTGPEASPEEGQRVAKSPLSKGRFRGISSAGLLKQTKRVLILLRAFSAPLCQSMSLRNRRKLAPLVLSQVEGGSNRGGIEGWFVLRISCSLRRCFPRPVIVLSRHFREAPSPTAVGMRARNESRSGKPPPASNRLPEFEVIP